MLGLAIADYVFAELPDVAEGHLAQVRAAVVSASALAAIATELDLGAALRLGKGEAASGGAAKPSILADGMEAVIAAVYLDGGWLAARAFVVGLLGERANTAAAGPGGRDYKTRLQEYSAQEFGSPPRYSVVATGPDHAKHFEASVLLDEQVFGEGAGGSKKKAQQAAARAAWRRIEGPPANQRVAGSSSPS